MLREASRSSLPSDLPAIVELGQPRAGDPAVSGAKAASLTAAKRAGLPVLPGFVITAPAAASVLERRAWTRLEGALEAAIRSAWLRLSADESRAVIVRSSSLIEDSGTSSMAGMFTSVSSVSSWAAFLDAVDAVLASSQTSPFARARARRSRFSSNPSSKPRSGGVMFGLDPVTGRRDRLLVSAVPGTPEKLVQGEADDARYLLTRSGRLVERTGSGGATLTRKQRKALAALAACRLGRRLGRPGRLGGYLFIYLYRWEWNRP